MSETAVMHDPQQDYDLKKVILGFTFFYILFFQDNEYLLIISSNHF